MSKEKLTLLLSNWQRGLEFSHYPKVLTNLIIDYSYLIPIILDTYLHEYFVVENVKNSKNKLIKHNQTLKRNYSCIFSTQAINKYNFKCIAPIRMKIKKVNFISIGFVNKYDSNNLEDIWTCDNNWKSDFFTYHAFEGGMLIKNKGIDDSETIKDMIGDIRSNDMVTVNLDFTNPTNGKIIIKVNNKIIEPCMDKVDGNQNWYFIITHWASDDFFEFLYFQD